ncbi:probable pectin methylesterase CGR3 [Benincasa hispida]|uniref:probable pectin methylesterase CGR3 n=1 Tax=Benincasa hispida TaxID=102211 RepID=UPI0019003B20|nr:probable pectin methylesterase CGR3 [Benincasa hispida]
MDSFEVSILNTVPLRQNPVRTYVVRGASRYISSDRYRSLSSLLLLIGLLIMVITLALGYLYHASGGQTSHLEADNEVEGQTFCSLEVQTMIPLLREVYDDSMTKVLYVGPDTCSMMSELLIDEEEYEAWGVEPYGSDGSDFYCWDLIHKGIIRVADMKFSLPYRENSFSHVIISDTLEYFSPRYLNSTIPELMRVSRDGVIIFAGYPDYPITEFTRYKFNREAKLRSPSWWKRYLVQRKLEENEAAKKRFKKILRDISYKPACQIFFLKSG